MILPNTYRPMVWLPSEIYEGGQKDLKHHVATKKHWNKTKLRLTNYRLGGKEIQILVSFCMMYLVEC